MTTAEPPSPATAREISEQLFGRITLGSMAGGFVIMAVIVATTAWLLVRSDDFRFWVDHTYQVEQEIADFQVFVERAEAARRGYLLSGQDRFRTTYERAVAPLSQSLKRIRVLTRDNARQQRRLDRMDALVAEKLTLMGQSVALRRTRGLAAAAEVFQRPEELTALRDIRLVAAEMTREEQTLLVGRSARQTGNGRLLLMVVIVAGALLALLAAGSTWVMRRFAGDLTRSRAQLAKLNEGLEEAVKDRTADLTRANAEIQRFAYIVSHDLRSPLVNIMGFTSELETASKPLRKLVEDARAKAPELVTREAGEAVDIDLPESIGFIRSSTQKMDRLISAILKLSREGRRSLNPELLAMNAVVDGVVQSLTIQAEGRGATVTIEGKLPDLVGDRVAMEQVFSNLIENALKYLKPGRPGRVTIRGHEEGARVFYEVEDNGRGIDPKDHERVFELFRRAGTQDQPGEGIGLAHVRALVYRLGGLIDCVSALDQGATFRLSLPRILVRDTGEAS